ncbi:MAG TPA: MarR family transcriptional regulator [Pseudonocardia sp.]|jgi:DNA-binding MarR family transcriptional regulator
MRDVFGSDLAGRLHLALARLHRRVRSEHTQGTLPTVQLSALDNLHRHGTLSPRELARCERIRPPTMTKLIAVLAGSGLITRRVHPEDRRQSILELTPEGHRVLSDTASETERWVAKRLVELDDADREDLAAAIRILDKITAQ